MRDAAFATLCTCTVFLSCRQPTQPQPPCLLAAAAPQSCEPIHRASCLAPRCRVSVPFHISAIGRKECAKTNETRQQISLNLCLKRMGHRKPSTAKGRLCSAFQSAQGQRGDYIQDLGSSTHLRETLLAWHIEHPSVAHMLSSYRSESSSGASPSLCALLKGLTYADVELSIRVTGKGLPQETKHNLLGKPVVGNVILFHCHGNRSERVEESNLCRSWRKERVGRSKQGSAPLLVRPPF